MCNETNYVVRFGVLGDSQENTAQVECSKMKILSQMSRVTFWDEEEKED